MGVFNVFRSERPKYLYTYGPDGNGGRIDTGARIIGTEEYINKKGKAAIALISGLAAFGILSDKGLGLWGHGAKEKTETAMNKEAIAAFNEARTGESPAELFASRYSDTMAVSVNRIEKGHTGISGPFVNSGYLGGGGGRPHMLEVDPMRDYLVGDECLTGTSFDINQVSDEGEFTAHASYDQSRNILTIRSVNAEPEKLHFGVEGTALSPRDQTTENILGTYGCSDEVHLTYTQNSQVG